MKKCLSFILLFAILLTLPVWGLSVGAIDEDTPVYERKAVEMYALNKYKNPDTVTCLFREDLEGVPFVTPQDYLDHILSVKVGVSDNGDGTFTFSNGDYHMTVDANRDTVSFDCYEGFVTLNSIVDFVGEDHSYYQNDPALLSGLERDVTLDLGAYYIDVVSDGGDVYLPYVTLNDLIDYYYLGMIYKDQRLRIVDTYIRYSSESDNMKYTESRDKALADFTYSELCFVMDHLYGAPSRAELSGSIREYGFDRALSEYNAITARVRELLKSENAEEYCTGIRLLDYYLSDGDHTSLTSSMKKLIKRFSLNDAASAAEKLFPDSEKEELGKIRETELKKQQKTAQKSSLDAAKAAAYATFEPIKSWGSQSLFRSDDTYFFNFSYFDSSAVEPFKWSMDYAAEHHAKNFVIDVTLNHGGEPEVAAYMLSLINPNSRFLSRSAVTGSLMPMSARIDRNLDGVIDEKDAALKYDFNCAILTSGYSYSCANLLPCIAQDYGVAILGETSSGGSCNISIHYYPDGACYALSGWSVYIHESGEDVDGGASPDVPLPGAEAGYEGFYDIKRMNEGLDEFYHASAKPYICGDYDSDGKVTIIDATRASKILAGILPAPSEELLMKVDTDGDRKLSIVDATYIQRYLAKLAAPDMIGQTVK